jgi:hypothetical protein
MEACRLKNLARRASPVFRRGFMSENAFHHRGQILQSATLDQDDIRQIFSKV